MINSLLKPRTMLVALGFAVVLVVFGGYQFYRSERKSLATSRQSDLKAIALLKVSQLEQWQKERLSEAVFFSTNQPLIAGAQRIINGDKGAEEYLRQSLTHIRSNNRYENIFILDTRGRIVFTLDSSFVEVDGETSKLSEQVVAQRQILFTDFYSCRLHQSIHLDIIAPLAVEGGSPFGALVFRVNPNDYIFPIIQDWPTPSKTAETLLVRADGDSVVFINTLRHIDNAPLTLRFSLTRKDIPAVQAILGHKGLYEGVDYRGHKVVSVMYPVNNTPWFMVTKIDRGEIFEDLYFRTGLIIAITALVILLVGITLAWYYANRQRMIYQMLLDRELQLHQSHEQFRATLYSIGDGVITTDKDGMVQQMNPVAEELTGWSEKEAKGKSLREVFAIINEDSRQEVENPVAKVLREGRVVGLANHTLLISKSGREIPIADSGSPIRNSRGIIAGVVLVFRDQTEEREQQRELALKEERYRSTLNNMLEGCQILNYNWEYLYINDAAAAHNKRPKEDLLGNRYEEMWPGVETTEVYQRIKACLEEGVTSNMENEFVFPDGSRGWFNLSIQPIPEGAFILSIDITQQKRDAELLITQKRFLQDLIENSGALVFVKDIEGRYELINRKWEEVTGIKREVVLGKTDEEVFPVEVGRRFRQMDMEVIATQRVVDGEESMFDGQGVRYFLSTKFPLFNPDGSLRGICGMSTDITHRKNTENELLKSKALVQTIIDNMPIGIGVNSFSPPVQFQFLNDNFTKFYGVTREEISKPNSFWEAVYKDPVYREQIRSRVQADMDSDDPQRMHWENIPITNHEGKVVRYINARNIPLPEKKLVISAVWDVTEQRQNEEQIIRLNDRLHYLIQTLSQLTLAQSTKDIQRIVTIASRKLVNSDGCTFVLRDGNQCYYIDEDAIASLWKGRRFRVDECISGWVMLNGKTAIIPDIYADSRIPVDAYKPTFVKSLVMVPLSKTNPMGAIGNYWANPYSPTGEEIQLIETLADAAERAFENFTLYEEMEQRVKDKTMELSERIVELERFHEATIDRELRMKELRDEIRRLKGEA